MENVASGLIVPTFGEFYYTHGNYNTKESFDIIIINNFSQARRIFSNVAPIYRTLMIILFFLFRYLFYCFLCYPFSYDETPISYALFLLNFLLK